MQVDSNTSSSTRYNQDTSSHSSKKDTITPLSRHIAYENEAASEDKPNRYKKTSSEKLSGLLDTVKLTNRQIGRY